MIPWSLPVSYLQTLKEITQENSMVVYILMFYAEI